MSAPHRTAESQILQPVKGLHFDGAVCHVSLVINTDEFAVRGGRRQISFQQHFFGQDRVLQQRPYTWPYGVLSCMSPTSTDLGCLSPSSSTRRQSGGMWVSLRHLASRQMQLQVLHQNSGTLDVFTISKLNRCTLRMSQASVLSLRSTRNPLEQQSQSHHVIFLC